MQLINFAILAFVMWKYVLPRIQKMLDDRKTGISEALAEAERAREAAQEAKLERAKQTTEMKDEGERILQEARDAAKAEAEQIIAAGRTEAEQLQVKTSQQLDADRARLRTELRAELAGLTIETTRKVLSQVVSSADQEKMAKLAARQLKKGVRSGR